MGIRDGSSDVCASDLAEALGRPVIDHYWQTESGWPILTSVPGVEQTPVKYGSPSFPAFGYDLKLLRENDGGDAGPNEKRSEGPRVGKACVGRCRSRWSAVHHKKKHIKKTHINK